MPPKRRVATTADGIHRIPDLLGGDFSAVRPDAAWVGDISYIPTRQGFPFYLAFVLDLASRRVVGVSTAPHLASLATDTLREAIATRGGHVQGVVFH